MQRLGNPYPVFFDQTGALAYGNQIYLGVAEEDPQAQPIVGYWDPGLTQIAEQPLKTIGGRIVNGSVPSDVFFAEPDFSLRQLDPFGVLVYYSPSVFAGGVAYQPLDTDLTAIAQLSTTDFGRGLLTLANAAALASAAGVSNFTGGQVSTNITRQGAGNYPYYADAAMTGGRIFDPVPVGTTPSISQPGDIQGFY